MSVFVRVFPKVFKLRGIPVIGKEIRVNKKSNIKLMLFFINRGGVVGLLNQDLHQSFFDLEVVTPLYFFLNL